MNNRLNKQVPPLKSEKPIFYERANIKSMWTYKSEMLFAMNELYKILKQNDIKLSLAVYPWPQQLENDVVNSIHVKMWRDFCNEKCFKFINFFPFFFEEVKKSSYLEVYKKYYFWNDVHFNAEGNRIIAQKLLKEF